MLKLVLIFALSFVIASVRSNPLADLTNDFGFRFYNQLKDAAKFRNKNLFFSPLSIAIAMGMTHLGARGNTAQEMETTFNWDPQTVNQDFKQLLGQTMNPNSSEVVLRLANRIWGKKGMTILRSFFRDSGRYFNARMALADFANVHGREQARLEINKWVENKTENKIRELLKRGVLNANTRMVLVNAIYFKGTWKYQFDKKKTFDATFNRLDGSAIRVKFMKEKGEYNYFADNGLSERCQVLELLYAGDKVSMFFVLPRRRGSAALRSLQQDISSTVVDLWVNSVRKTNISIYIPRFKVQHGFGAKGFLKNLGVRDLFSRDAADLSGIAGRRGLYVSKVVHKAFVEVNEKGTEAAAASAVVVSIRGGRHGFRADHPFLYFIYHKQSRSILFMGRVMDPSQEKVE